MFRLYQEALINTEPVIYCICLKQTNAMYSKTWQIINMTKLGYLIIIQLFVLQLIFLTRKKSHWYSEINVRSESKIEKYILIISYNNTRLIAADLTG